MSKKLLSLACSFDCFLLNRFIKYLYFVYAYLVIFYITALRGIGFHRAAKIIGVFYKKPVVIVYTLDLDPIGLYVGNDLIVARNLRIKPGSNRK